MSMRPGVLRELRATPEFNRGAHRGEHFYDWSECFTVDGTLSVVAYPFRLPIPYRSGLVGVYAFVDTAPTGAAIILDLNRNATTIFTTQSKRPQIPAGEKETGLVTDIDVTIFHRGDFMTPDVDQVGSTQPGANLVIGTYWRFAA